LKRHEVRSELTGGDIRGILEATGDACPADDAHGLLDRLFGSSLGFQVDNVVGKMAAGDRRCNVGLMKITRPSDNSAPLVSLRLPLGQILVTTDQRALVVRLETIESPGRILIRLPLEPRTELTRGFLVRKEGDSPGHTICVAHATVPSWCVDDTAFPAGQDLAFHEPATALAKPGVPFPFLRDNLRTRWDANLVGRFEDVGHGSPSVHGYSSVKL